jgi:hypothetical protein
MNEGSIRMGVHPTNDISSHFAIDIVTIHCHYFRVENHARV